MGFRRRLTVFNLGCTLTIIVLLLLNVGKIKDDLKLYSYSPNEAVAGLVSDTTMTVHAKTLFYINHPELDDKTTFNKNCPNNGGDSITVLGCYHSGENGIYLYNVSDPVLNGVIQVTAAHEMLHAAYERLSSADRSRVNDLLNSYYQSQSGNKTLTDQVAIYQKTEPNSVNDEMHSLFGTTITNLPSELQSYYSQYFSNRQSIIDDYNKYESVFSSKQLQIASYDSELAGMLQSIKTNEASLKTQLDDINKQKSLLNQSSGDAQANSQIILRLNSLIDQYNSLVNTTTSLISSYNGLIKSRNELASQFDELGQELNSNITSIPSSQ